MNLVEDDDFPGQGEAADEEVFHRHHGLQRLINGADAVGCEQRLLGRGEPRTSLADVVSGILAVLFLPRRERRREAQVEVVFQPSVAVRQPERCVIGKGVAEKLLDAPVNSIACHLRGQREINSLVMAGGDELLRGEQSRLCFTAAHRPFDHDNPGLERRSRDGLLNLVRREGGASCPKGGGETRCPKLAARPADLTQCLTGFGARGLQWQPIARREPSFVRANPVRNGDETRMQP